MGRRRRLKGRNGKMLKSRNREATGIINYNVKRTDRQDMHASRHASRPM
jgi:hypothetical protein